MRNKTCVIFLIALALFSFRPQNIFAEIEKVEVGIDGLSCPFCVWGLEKKLKALNSIEKVSIHLKQAKAEISLKPNVPLDIVAIKKAVKEAGFSTRHIRITAIGNLIEKKGEILFSIKDTGQKFLVYKTDTVSKAKLSEIIKGNVTVGIEGRVHEDKELALSLGLEKMEMVK